MFDARLRMVALWIAQAALLAAIVGLLRICFWDPAVSGPVAVLVVLGVLIGAAPVTGPLSEALPRRWLLAGVGVVVAVLALGIVPDGMIRLSLASLCLALVDPLSLGLLRRAAPARGVAWADVVALAAAVLGMTLPFEQENLYVIGLALLAVAAAAVARFDAETVASPLPWRRRLGGVLADRTVVALLVAPTLAELLLVFVGVMVFGPALVAGGWEACGPVLVGAGLGGLLVGLQSHPCRNLGLTPYGAAIAAAVFLVALRASEATRAWPLAPLLGCAAAVALLPLRIAFLDRLPAPSRSSALALRNALLAAGLLPLLSLLSLSLPPEAALGAVGLAVVLAVLAWWALFRHAIETATEWLFLPLYRIRAHGPGKERLPRAGPLLIVANHSSWADPLWVGKVTPRFLRPMMTSVFYDLPGLRWLMSRVVQAIRVPKTPFRREAPELAEAVAGLKKGQCIVVFPEGRLRRTEEELLGAFGQGVWRILREVPTTPVAVCWIEGGWGSFTSYKDGLPMRGKRLDFLRRIDIAFAEPRVVPSEALADPTTTRRFLRQACLECRRYLGLEVPAEMAGPVEDVQPSNPDSSSVRLPGS